ncbi:hypothetical protein [Niastella sp. OAS944]|uniref:hypothetical protein n=1 Tax=Niastella sp. OAS944 TaxID=2664089 RepID=UPI00349B020B|nr:hypothetical protein [Chitinophagaceae bacterium OAS944]
MINPATQTKGILLLVALFIMHSITLNAQTRAKDEKRFVNALNELVAYKKPSMGTDDSPQFILDSLFHILGDSLTITQINTFIDSSVSRYRYMVGLNQISVGHDLNLVLYAGDDGAKVYAQRKGRQDWEYSGPDNLILVGLVQDDDKKAQAIKKKIEAAWKRASRWYKP